MKKLWFAWSCCILFSLPGLAQEIGIGTSNPNPQSLLHIDVGNSTTRGLLVTGSAITGVVPDLGIGPKLMFYPGKAAFREGYTSGSQWYNASTGYYSVAMGANTTASADYSVALGGNTTASGQYSLAMGNGSMASANYSNAFGLTSTAGGLYAFAAGNTCTANGQSSFAFGSGAAATGDYSVAIGHSVNTNLKTGGFFLADSDPFNKGVRIVGSNDQMCMRFNGGYYFISNNNGPDIGVQVVAGGNSWAVVSDVRLKENFLPIDEENFLHKIATLNLTTWNYKGQDPRHFRHFGPMAQDLYAAFGKDEFGSIGCDTLINQQDLIGVNLVAVQALEKRTSILDRENTTLRNEVLDLKERLTKMEKLLNR